MIRKEFKPYFDVNQHSDGIVARAYQEERSGADQLKLRVVHAERYVKTRVDKDSWEYNRHSNAEKEATVRSFELAEQGFDLIIWISPESEIYEEGRLNIMLPVVDNGELAFDPWGVPLKLDEIESMGFADRLLGAGGLSMDPIYDQESLRRQPIGFRLGTGSWLGKCEELIPEMNDVWDEIRSGGVDQNMRVIAGQVNEAKIIAKGNNIIFEMEMARRGYKLNVAGDHGGSWLSTLANKGIYNFKINRINGKYFAEKVKVNGKWVCPICGKEISEGSSVCSKCGVGLKSSL